MKKLLLIISIFLRLKLNEFFQFMCSKRCWLGISKMIFYSIILVLCAIIYIVLMGMTLSFIESFTGLGKIGSLILFTMLLVSVCVVIIYSMEIKTFIIGNWKQATIEAENR